MLLRPRKKDGASPRERALWGDLLSMGMVFPIAILLGLWVGGWVGGKLGHPAGGRIVGLIWGILAAFWELFKVTSKMARAADAETAAQAAEAEKARRKDEDPDA